MTSNRELTRLRTHLQSPPRDADIDEDVQAAINELSVRTRAQVSAVKQIAMELESLRQRCSPAPAPQIMGSIPYLRNRMMSRMLVHSVGCPYPKILGRKSVGQHPCSFGLSGIIFKVSNPVTFVSILRLIFIADRVIRTLESHQYTPDSGLPPYPDLLKDLYSRLDFKDNDASPRTFEPQMKHFQEFDVLLAILQEYGKGRNIGFVKIKVPG